MPVRAMLTNSGSGERVLTRKVSVGSKKLPLAGSVTAIEIRAAREEREEEPREEDACSAWQRVTH